MFYQDEFMKTLRERHLSPRTILAYRVVLARFEHYCRSTGISNAQGISEKTFHDYLSGLISGEPVSQTISNHIGKLRRYFRFLEDHGYVFISPSHSYQMPRVWLNHFPAVSEIEIEEILSGIRVDGPLSIKGKAILELAYSSALRPREVYRLKLDDIDFKEGLLFIEQSKNKKDRMVPVGTTALKWVKRYIEEVRQKYLRGQTHSFVFISHKTGAPLTVWGVRWAVQETLRRNGFTPFKPYSLRSSAATHLLLEGMGILHISRLLGHEDIRTTMGYLSVKLKELQKELSLKHPRQRMAQSLSRRKEKSS